MTETPSDRRQFPRVPVSFDVDVEVEPAGRPARTMVGRLADLSAGGAFLELAGLLEP
ncbi:MAG: PilZ domain-containing protein [Acidobacteria bacterium]|nr:PilZ domain-containing protein [Acidobacteriota bacterium]